MTNQTQPDGDGLVLTSLDGSNPLAFLAALGTLRTLSLAWPERKVKMRWTQYAGAWRPTVEATETLTPSMVTATLAEHLRCGFEPGQAPEEDRNRCQKEHEKIKTEIKKTREDLKKRGLKGDDRRKAEKSKLEPLEEKARSARAAWLESLSHVVPFAEMRLGKHLDSTHDEFRDTAEDMLHGASQRTREQLDMLAAFGSDGCFDEKTFRIQATPFCFATGSGHQYFLETARQLVGQVTEQRIHSTLFDKWIHTDEKLSMRWDPVEDRRYALMWMDPTDSKNKATTNWAANLIAYRGLQLLPSFPTQSGLGTVAFQQRRYFMWPIWEQPLPADVVLSLLRLPALAREPVDSTTISAMGVQAIHRAERLIVGNPPLHKVNFSPATAVF